MDILVSKDNKGKSELLRLTMNGMIQEEAL